MSRRVKRLTDLEIDEISLVDRAANQHAVMAFSKSDQEEQMPEFYDSDGDPIDTDELETGDHILDADGNEYVYVSDEDAEQFDLGEPEQGQEYDYEDADDRELVGVGKALPGVGRLGNAYQRFKGGAMLGALGREGRLGEAAGVPLGGRAGALGYGYGARPKTVLGAAGGLAAVPPVVGGTALAVRRKKQREEASKSDLGKSVYYELSKALNDSDRDEVIAKAMDAVDVAYKEAAEARALAEQMATERLRDEYISKAQEYDVPVAPEELGSLLMHAAQTFSKKELATLETILQSGGADLSEYGMAGGGVPSEVLAQFEYLADEVVGKSDLTHAEAMTALFEANPAAYDAYLAETVR